MTRDEQKCVWEILTKQIEALEPKVDASYDVYVDGLVALRNLKNERDRLWCGWVNEMPKAQ